MKFELLGHFAGLVTYGCKEGKRQWVISKDKTGVCQASFKKSGTAPTEWLGTDYPNYEAALAACEQHRKKRLQ